MLATRELRLERSEQLVRRQPQTWQRVLQWQWLVSDEHRFTASRKCSHAQVFGIHQQHQTHALLDVPRRLRDEFGPSFLAR